MDIDNPEDLNCLLEHLANGSPPGAKTRAWADKYKDILISCTRYERKRRL